MNKAAQTARIADIATLQNGYAFRGRIEPDDEGDTRVIQASDLTQDTKPHADKLACVHLGKKVNRYHLSETDIVFMARGLRQLAYRPIRQAVTGKPIITTFGLLVISPNEQKASADYLHWVLNTPQVQQRLQSKKEGTSISFISEKNFGSVEIPLPTLEHQKKISQLIALHKHREHVRQQLAKTDEKITHTTAWSLATEQ
ncbi:MAG: restriction endonuclease subunit S [Granulosicoccus sp.]